MTTSHQRGLGAAPGQGGARAVAEAIEPVINLVFPPRCPLCGDQIGDPVGLCSVCWSGLVFPGHACCVTCAMPSDFPVRDDARPCAVCASHPPPFDAITAATYYTDCSRRLVLAFKHGRKLALARLMATMIAARLPPCAAATLVIPVPLHRVRLWFRGFNQAGLLARELAARTGLAWLPDGLVRTRRTPKLGGLGRGERRELLDGAIAVPRSARDRIAGASVLLVDDVMTSGATAEACARALRKAGAPSVRVACFSRVLPGGERETPEAARPRASA